MRKRKRVKKITLYLLLAFSILIPLSATIGLKTAQMTFLPQLLQATNKSLSYFEVAKGEWFVEATGTCFEITASKYLNIILSSSESVQMHLESIPKMVSFIIESKSSVTSTLITLSGFEPLTTYYLYQNDQFVETFTTDSNGEYSYSQDISQPCHVYIKEEPSTIYISSDFTFNRDINEPIYVVADNIVIDGNGYSLQGSGSYGFYLYGRSNVTIKNVLIKGWLYGIMLWASSGNIITGNNIEGNSYYGISSPYSSNNKFSRNKISESGWFGLMLTQASTNIITENNITNNRYGIRATFSSNNSIFENYIMKNSFLGIELSFSTNNLIYHNNLINNTNQVQDRSPMENDWHHPDLLEGNYWSDYTGIDDGSGIGNHSIAGDGIGDTDIPWPQTGYDNYPFMEENGWKKSDNEIFQGFGSLRIGRRRIRGEGTLILYDDLICVEIRDQSASWDILNRCEIGCFEFYYGNGDLGRMFIFIYRRETSCALAMGRRVFFCGHN
ncbi:MAG: right-handed parallel beta-helix repeat-containing protein [Candidatus Helarchaeota archaeon]|nr:right-handed parallel beta-helix repeat-containing protein [Candidatus Helarchaeota archaeon]